jgi:hypothetical protein
LVGIAEQWKCEPSEDAELKFKFAAAVMNAGKPLWVTETVSALANCAIHVWREVLPLSNMHGKRKKGDCNGSADEGKEDDEEDKEHKGGKKSKKARKKRAKKKKEMKTKREKKEVKEENDENEGPVDEAEEARDREVRIYRAVMPPP